MRIAGILLAAGRGTRFGAHKLLCPVEGVPMVLGAARALAPLDGVIAVTREGDQKMRDGLAAAGIRSVGCPTAGNGMGASIACGIAATAGWDGWIVALGDMPFVSAETVEQLARLLRRGAQVAAPVYRGRRGNPVGFGAEYAPLLGALTGEEGARRLIRTFVPLEVDDPGVLIDIDTPDDLCAQH